MPLYSVEGDHSGCHHYVCVVLKYVAILRHRLRGDFWSTKHLLPAGTIIRIGTQHNTLHINDIRQFFLDVYYPVSVFVGENIFFTRRCGNIGFI